MVILDFALQGIRDLKAAVRLRLQSGYNALVCPQVKAETVILGFLETLFPTGFDQKTQAMVTAAGSGGGLTLMAADGTTFRIKRDFKTGAAQLMEFKKGTKTFAPLADTAKDIEQVLRARLSLPSRAVFESVFVLRPKDLPSQAALPNADDEQSANVKIDPETLRARLRVVEEQLKALDDIANLEFELDGLQKQRFAIADRLKALQFDQSSLDEVQEQTKRIAFLDVLPEDFQDQFNEYLKAKHKRDTDLERWQAEREIIEHTERVVDVAPVMNDWRLWTGLAVGIVACAAAIGLDGIFRYLALLDIPAFGLSTFVLYQHLSQREEREGGKRKIRFSNERRERILAKDAELISKVESLLQQTDLAEPQDVVKGLKLRQEVRERLAALKTTQKSAAENPEVLELTKQHTSLSQSIAALEERLANTAANPVDGMILREEAKKLKEQLGPYLEPVSLEMESQNPLGETWLRAAADLLLTDAPSAVKTVSERASLLLRAMSENRLAGVQLEPKGAIQIRSAQGNVSAWGDMPDAVKDLTYLALRAGLVLAIDQRSRAPMVCGDVAGKLASSGSATTQMLLETLAAAGQLLHLVKRPEDAPKAKLVSTVG